MQKSPSPVTSGPIAPAISGPKKDHEVLLFSGLIVSLAVIIGGFWYYSSIEQTTATVPDRLTETEVSEALKNTTQPAAMPVSLPVTQTQGSLQTPSVPDIIHRDLFFEVGRKGLTDEARSIIQQQAVLLKNDGDLGVLVQGYTDRQGSAGYNLALGMKRAESVKTELMSAGVAEHQIKTVSLGKEGVLCIDNSDVCRQMNRRVHLEIRTIGQEHMVPPIVTTTPDSTEATQASADQNQSSDEQGSLGEMLIPSVDAAQPADPNTTSIESASGEPASGS
ncbi:MAG: OmpA family protein [Nitrospira sp.]|nr:OmpA family protein [Nitrospira sp.]